jgi:hypothetical protein
MSPGNKAIDRIFKEYNKTNSSIDSLVPPIIIPTYISDTPYRTAAIVKVEKDACIKYGKLKAPAPKKEHKCNLPRPSWPKRLFVNSIYSYTVGDLWRCDECGKVYKYSVGWYNQPSNFRHTKTVDECIHKCGVYCDYWKETNIDEWKSIGGAE